MFRQYATRAEIERAHSLIQHWARTDQRRHDAWRAAERGWHLIGNSSNTADGERRYFVWMTAATSAIAAGCLDSTFLSTEPLDRVRGWDRERTRRPGRANPTAPSTTRSRKKQLLTYEEWLAQRPYPLSQWRAMHEDAGQRPYDLPGDHPATCRCMYPEEAGAWCGLAVSARAMDESDTPQQHYQRLLRAAAGRHRHSNALPSDLTVAQFRIAVRCHVCGPLWAWHLLRQLRKAERAVLQHLEFDEHTAAAHVALRTSESFTSRLRLLRRRKDLRKTIPPWPEIPSDAWAHWDDDRVRERLVGIRERTPDWVLR